MILIFWGKMKIRNQKQISENNLFNHKNIITALLATSKDLNTESLPKPDQNQQRQRNGGINDVTARNFCSTDTSQSWESFEYIDCSSFYNNQCFLVYDKSASLKCSAWEGPGLILGYKLFLNFYSKLPVLVSYKFVITSFGF